LTHEVREPSDARLALYRDLKDSARRRRAELGEGVFVVEGRLALEAALTSSYSLLSVLALERRLDVLSGLRIPEGVPVLVASDEVMRTVTGFDVHRGLLALASRPTPTGPDELLARQPASPVVVVEGINDQENLGSIFRNAAAFGAGAIFLDPTSSDPLYRRTVRVSLGLVLRVPFARLVPWPATLDLLRNEGFVLLALSPRAQAEPIAPVAHELKEERVALVVGAEGPGLSASVLGQCRAVRVPMAPGADSLNVAAATAVALHRFSRV